MQTADVRATMHAEFKAFYEFKSVGNLGLRAPLGLVFWRRNSAELRGVFWYPALTGGVVSQDGFVVIGGGVWRSDRAGDAGLAAPLAAFAAGWGSLDVVEVFCGKSRTDLGVSLT